MERQMRRQGPQNRVIIKDGVIIKDASDAARLIQTEY